MLNVYNYGLGYIILDTISDKHLGIFLMKWNDSIYKVDKKILFKEPKRKYFILKIFLFKLLEKFKTFQKQIRHAKSDEFPHSVY